MSGETINYFIASGNSKPSNNIWDNGSVGNYWSDYESKYPNASEVDSSGIGNTPYVIDQNNTDHYPLLQQAYSSNYTSTTASTPTATSSPTPSIPELSWLAIIPLLLSMFSVAVILRHRKPVKKP